MTNGERVLLAAEPSGGVLWVHPAAVIDRMLALLDQPTLDPSMLDQSAGVAA